MPVAQKVLVFLFGSLGDSIVAIPALRMVRGNFPTAEIVILHESGLGLVEPPEVIPTSLADRFIGYTRGAFAPLSYLRLLPRLRLEKFDAAVYLVFSERPGASVRRDKMYFRAAGIKRLIGFQPFSRAGLYPVNNAGHPMNVPQEAERKIARLEYDGLARSEDVLSLPWIEPGERETKKARTWLRENTESQAVIAIAPGCKTRANQWPVERFVELIRTLGAQSDVGVVIVGGPNEAALGDGICGQVTGCVNAAGKFSVRETAALLRSCDAYVGLDTGTTHLAAAVGTPVIGIYGQRNNPGQWFPIAADLQLVQHQVDCAGCRLQRCSLDGHPCMAGIGVSDVLPAVLDTLSRKQVDAEPLSAREAA